MSGIVGGHGALVLAEIQQAFDALELNLKTQAIQTYGTTYSATVSAPYKSGGKSVSISGTITVGSTVQA